MGKNHAIPIHKRIPKPPRVPDIMYCSEHGKPSLQSMMGLANDPVKFRKTLNTIRAVWRSQKVDNQLPYWQQDPAKVRSVELEVLQRLPFLTVDYEDAWPVTFYLQKAMKSHGYESKYKRSDADDNSDAVEECIERPGCVPHRLYDSGDGVPSLQSAMKLQDNLGKLRTILKMIREVWQEQGVDYLVSYSLQDPNRMRSVELELLCSEQVIKRLPFLAKNYEDAWPVTFYLRMALKSHYPQHSSKRKRLGTGDAHGEDDKPEDEYNEASPHPPQRSPCPPQRRTLPDRAARKKTMRVGRGIAGSKSTTAVSNKRHRQTTETLRRRTSQASLRAASSTSSDLLTRSAVGSSIASTSSPATQVVFKSSRSASPSSPVPQQPREPRTIHSRPHDQPEDGKDVSSSIHSCLRSAYGLPQADADRIVKVLASIGVTDASYLRVLANMQGRDNWLREMRDKGEITEIQRLIVRETLARM